MEKMMSCSYPNLKVAGIFLLKINSQILEDNSRNSFSVEARGMTGYYLFTCLLFIIFPVPTSNLKGKFLNF